ncbi:MAG: hypothetical protein ABGZ17_27240 [Planctomycetaceae bacterium]
MALLGSENREYLSEALIADVHRGLMERSRIRETILEVRDTLTARPLTVAISTAREWVVGR